MHNDGYFTEEIAATYDRDVSEAFETSALDPIIDTLQRLAGDGSMLEFGIGTGRVALPLAQRGLDVHGIDLSKPMIDRLKQKPGSDRINVTVGDFSTTRVPGVYSLLPATVDDTSLYGRRLYRPGSRITILGIVQQTEFEGR